MKRHAHSTRGLIAAAAIALILAGCGTSTPSATPQPTATASPSPAAFDLSKVEDSVAQIHTQGTFITPDGAKELAYTGSGFVVDADGFVVTNNHVVTGGAFWKVQIGKDPALLDAQLVGVSECSDLAVLKVSGTFPALVMSSTVPTVGEKVYVAGHPLGDTYTLTDGIVAKPVAASETSWASVKQEFRITAQTSPGNSGSPVVDANGNVLGVHYAGGVVGSEIQGQSFAIASSEAKGIIDAIKAAQGNLDYIGVNGEVNEAGTGIAIISVAPGSPADKAGIEPGDLMVDLNGTATGTDGTKSTYCSVLRSHKSDDTLSVTIMRAGKTFKGEINGRPLAVVDTGSGGGGGSAETAIDQLQAYVPSAYWSSCEHSTTAPYNTIVQTAVCDATGVDAVWYDLYDSKGDLADAYASDVAFYKAEPSSGGVETSCGSRNTDATWSVTFTDGTEIGDDSFGLLCYKDDKGNAWMQQADPTNNIMFTVELTSGDRAGLYTWWMNNNTVLSVQP